MPSFTCKCGVRLDIGDIPNANEWLLISDIEYDKFQENLDAEALYKCFQHMLKCTQCQRLWIFWDGFHKNPQCYEIVTNK